MSPFAPRKQRCFRGAKGDKETVISRTILRSLRLQRRTTEKRHSYSAFHLGAGVARNRISSAASMASPPCLVRADGAARLRRSAAPSADICRFAEIISPKPNSQRLLNRVFTRLSLPLSTARPAGRRAACRCCCAREIRPSQTACSLNEVSTLATCTHQREWKQTECVGGDYRKSLARANSHERRYSLFPKSHIFLVFR